MRRSYSDVVLFDVFHISNIISVFTMRFSKCVFVSIIFVSFCVVNAISPIDPSNDHGQNDDIAIIKVPQRVYVALKRPYDDEDSRFMYVDRVYAVSYRQVEIRAGDYSELECGAVGFDVVVHHCDCKEYCLRRQNGRPQARPTSFDLNYRLSYYMNNNITYFSAAMREAIVLNRHGLFRASGELLADREGGYEHFGPFRKPELAYEETIRTNSGTEGRRTAVLFKEKTFKKWIIHEVVGNMALFKTLMRLGDVSLDLESFVSDLRQHYRQPIRPSAEPGADGDGIVVTLRGEGTTANVSLGQYECADVDDGHGNFSSPATIDEGGCVIAYDGHGCTGANRVVLQKHVSLHTEDRHLRRPFVQAAIKSVSGCCRSAAKDVLDDDSGPAPAYKLLRHSRCSCSCSAASTKPTAEEQWTRPPLKDKTNRPRWSELIAGFNATSTFATRLADEAAIAAVIAETPADRVAAASNAAVAATTVAEIGTRTAELIANSLGTVYPEHDGSHLVASIKELADIAVEVAARAATATPDTASMYAADAARTAAQLQGAISFVCESWPDDLDSTSAATTTKTAETRKRRRLGEWRTIFGGLRTDELLDEKNKSTDRDGRANDSINMWSTEKNNK